MLFAAGATQRLGKVQDGTSVLDHEPEEIKHHVSISTAFHSLPWKKYAITLIDTPGYAAFLADSINSMRAFGGAVFVLNPAVGLRVESEQLWARANEDRVSRLLFVTKMDHEPGDVEQRIAPILETLEAKGVYLQMPIGAEANFKGVVDLIAMKAYLYEGDAGKFAEAEIPADLKSAADEWRQKMIEDVCETDDRTAGKISRRQGTEHGRIKKSDPRGHQRTEKSFRFSLARRYAKSASRNCSMPSSTICHRRSMRAKRRGSTPPMAKRSSAPPIPTLRFRPTCSKP